MTPDHETIDVNAEVDRLFDDSSRPTEGPPTAQLILGGVASGKTTLRKARFSTGHVLIDAADVFLHLCRGRNLDFPGPLLEPMELLGRLIASRAVSERRNIVTELIGAEEQPLVDLMEALKSTGYDVNVTYVECTAEEGMRRNEARGPDDISAYFAGPYQIAWLMAATAARSTAPFS